MSDAPQSLAAKPLDTLTWQDFAPLVGQPFVAVAADEVEVPLILDQGWESPRTTRPSATRTNFSLMFRGKKDAPMLLADGCYILRTPVGDLPPLMIAPVMPPEGWGDGLCYQAVFN